MENNINALVHVQAIQNFSEKSRRKILFFYNSSTSPRDVPFKDELKVRLAALKQQQLLEPWCSDDCMPGSTRDIESQEWLNKAEIVTPLLSPDFFAAEALVNQIRLSIQRQKQGNTRVVPILIRPVDLPADFSGLEILPTESLPVSRWVDADLAWQNVYYGLTKSVLEIRFPFNEFRFSTESEQPAQAILILRIDPNKINQDILMEILKDINSIAVRFCVKLDKVMNGSTILLLKGSRTEINRIYYEFRYNGLKKIHDIEIDECIPLVDNNSISKAIDLTDNERAALETIKDEKIKLTLMNALIKREIAHLSKISILGNQINLAKGMDIRMNHVSILETICDDLDKMTRAILRTSLMLEQKNHIRTRFINKLEIPNVKFVSIINMGSYDIAIIGARDGTYSLMADWDGIQGDTGKKGVEISNLISREFAYEVVVLFFESKGYSLDSESREVDTIRVVGVSWSTGRRKVIEAIIDNKGIITYKEGADPLELEHEQNVLKWKP